MYLWYELFHSRVPGSLWSTERSVGNGSHICARITIDDERSIFFLASFSTISHNNDSKYYEYHTNTKMFVNVNRFDNINGFKTPEGFERVETLEYPVTC